MSLGLRLEPLGFLGCGLQVVRAGDLCDALATVGVAMLAESILSRGFGEVPSPINLLGCEVALGLCGLGIGKHRLEVVGTAAVVQVRSFFGCSLASWHSVAVGCLVLVVVLAFA